MGTSNEEHDFIKEALAKDLLYRRIRTAVYAFAFVEFVAAASVTIYFLCQLVAVLRS